MEESSGEYTGWAIVEFKKDAGVTVRTTAGEIAPSMLGGMAMLYVRTPETPGHESEEDWWAPTLIAHIKRADESTVLARLTQQRRGKRAAPAEETSDA